MEPFFFFAPITCSCGQKVGETGESPVDRRRFGCIVRILYRCDDLLTKVKMAVAFTLLH